MKKQMFIFLIILSLFSPMYGGQDYVKIADQVRCKSAKNIEKKYGMRFSGQVVQLYETHYGKSQKRFVIR